MKNGLNHAKENAYVIAETAFSHEGDSQYLYDLIGNMSSKNIDCVKLQLLLDKEDLFSDDHDLFLPISNYMIDPNKWKKLLSHAKSNDLDTLVILLDYAGINFAEKYNELIDYVEIHASCLTDIQFVTRVSEYCAKYQKKLFIVVSGYEIIEVDYIIDYIKKYTKDIILMHGFQNFPTKMEDCNLKKIDMLKDRYGLEVGYADHILFNDTFKELVILDSLINYTNIIEIHCVITEGEERIDYITALSPIHISEIMEKYKKLMIAKGGTQLDLSPAEKKYGFYFRKVPLAKKDLLAGKMLKISDITFKRVNNSLGYNVVADRKLLGCQISKNLKKNQQIKEGLK